MTINLDKISRYGTFLICLAVAVVVAWRGTSYVDPQAPSLIPAFMCSMFSLSMVFTGLAFAQGRSM
ncbi:hypothetical protein BH10PLA1_BH10PLA1_15490 [soil metagenome]